MKKPLVLLALTVLFIVGCKSDKKEDKGTAPKEEIVDPEPETPVAETTSDTAVLEIEGNDQMKFNQAELSVKAGQEVTLTLKHVGEMKVDVMGHNWVLLKPGTDIADFGLKAMDAKDNGYIPADSDVVIAHTDMIGGGQTITITFTAPAAGTYDFICSFPGHYGMMKGKLIVA